MDFDDLEAFVKISELKSFTKAAESLFITQPSISKRIKDLEARIGLRLIDRTRKRIKLTPSGESFLRYAKEILSLKRRLMNEMEARAKRERGFIRIGGSNIPGRYMLPKILSLHKERFSQIEVYLYISDSKDIVKKVEEEELDLGLVGMKKKSKEIEFKRLISDRIVIVGPRSYPDQLQIHELKEFPFISRELGSGTREAFETYLKRSGKISPYELNVVAQVSDTEALKETVKYGMGLSYISSLALEDSIENKELKVIKIIGLEEMQRFFYIVTKKTKHIPPQVKAFLETIYLWVSNEKK